MEIIRKRQRALTLEEIQTKLEPGTLVQHLSFPGALVVTASPIEAKYVRTRWVTPYGELVSRQFKISSLRLHEPKNAEYVAVVTHANVSPKLIRSRLQIGTTFKHITNNRFTMVVTDLDELGQIGAEYFVTDGTARSEFVKPTEIGEIDVEIGPYEGIA